MALWMAWWDAIWLLRPAFSRLRSFMWFATAEAGLTVRTELLDVTSIVRTLKLRPALYNKLRDSLHSDAVQLDQLAALGTQAVLRLFREPLRVNGRRVLVGDGIKVAKSDKGAGTNLCKIREQNCANERRVETRRSVEGI
ncbi:hypothetical protein OKW43_006455 [Paraburkholderia sp. WC7.3g]|uniref:hypothetical protein n=1 Tax=Paraburkholderia sp. WC7.3g TaxID=2991070 RepID=UPI003D221394